MSPHDTLRAADGKQKAVGLASYHTGSHGHRPSADERNRRAEDEVRFARTEREHRPLDGRHLDVQLVRIRQELRTRHALDRRVPRNVAFTHAGDMERHAHQQPHARHDGLLHHSVLLHRQRISAARYFIGERNGRRTGRSG